MLKKAPKAYTGTFWIATFLKLAQVVTFHGMDVSSLASSAGEAIEVEVGGHGVFGFSKNSLELEENRSFSRRNRYIGGALGIGGGQSFTSNQLFFGKLGLALGGVEVLSNGSKIVYGGAFSGNSLTKGLPGLHLFTPDFAKNHWGVLGVLYEPQFSLSFERKLDVLSRFGISLNFSLPDVSFKLLGTFINAQALVMEGRFTLCKVLTFKAEGLFYYFESFTNVPSKFCISGNFGFEWGLPKTHPFLKIFQSAGWLTTLQTFEERARLMSQNYIEHNC